MSLLLQKQQEFAYKIAKLIVAIYEQLGYKATLGEGYDDDNKGHMAGSTHYVRLAQDINLFDGDRWLKDGVEAEAAHGKVHDLWDTMGGAARIDRDLNHYSFEWGGKR